MILIVAALAFGIASQAWLAFSFGALPGADRARWPVAITLVVLLALPTAAILTAVWAHRASPVGWPLIGVIAVAGLLMRIPFFGVGPMMEDDHSRYLLDGAMVAHGLSPYASAPDHVLAGGSALPAKVLDAGRAAVAGINFPDLRSIYPGGAQALFALAHIASPWSIDGLRAVIFSAEALTAILLIFILKRSGRPPILAALVWCSPLLAFSLTGQAHIDAVLMPPILAALLLVQRRGAAIAGALLGFAVAVKLWPALLAPLMIRTIWPDRSLVRRFCMGAGLVAAPLCAPLVIASLTPNAGLVAYAGGWSVNNAPFAWTSYGFLLGVGEGIGERILRTGVMAVSVIAAVAIAIRPVSGSADLVSRCACLAALLFYLSPAQFPWYAVWFLPLAAAAGSVSLSAAAIGLPIYFLFFPLAEIGKGDLHNYGLAMLHLAPVAAVAMFVRPDAPGESRS